MKNDLKSVFWESLLHNQNGQTNKREIGQLIKRFEVKSLNSNTRLK